MRSKDVQRGGNKFDCSMIVRLEKASIMVNTAREALSPLFILASLFGFSVIEYPRGRPWTSFSFIYAFILWILFLYSTANIVSKYGNTRIFQDWATLYIMSVNLFAAIVTCFLNLHHDKKLKMAIDRLDSVLDTMEKLGSVNDLTKLQRTIKWKIGIWIIVSLCINSTDYVWWSYFCDVTTAIITPSILNSPYHFNVINDITIETILTYVGSKLDCVNEFIRSLTKDNINRKKQTRCMILSSTDFSSENADHRRHLTWTLMHLHLELRKICRSFNAVYGQQLILQMINNFAFITGLIYYGYVSFILDRRAFAFLILITFTSWGFLYFRKFFTINYLCEIVSRKANEITTVTQSLLNIVDDDELSEEMKQFILYLTYFPLKFTGLEFFDFGYTFIQKFLSMSTTFLIILIQMYKPPETDNSIDFV